MLSPANKTLVQRLVIGLLGGGFLLFLFGYGKETYALACALLCFLMQREFYRLCRVRQACHGLVAGLLLFFYTFFARLELISWLWGWIFLLFLPFILLTSLYRPNEPRVFENVGLILMGLCYVVLPWLLLNFWTLPVDGGAYDSQRLLGFCLLVWTYDSGAYFVGKHWGRHKLFPRLSPRKSWEGVCSGCVCAILLSYGLVLWTQNPEWWGIGFVVACAAPYGDLIASMLKRSLGVKDSGRMLGAHGGFIDRFDSFIFCIPFVLLYEISLYPLLFR